MQTINHHPQPGAAAEVARANRKDDAVHREAAEFLARLDFRHISSHLSHKKPGYYLILLRNEIRRSLRDKRGLCE